MKELVEKIAAIGPYCNNVVLKSIEVFFHS